jgi:2-methylcitrate dehydratase
VMPEQYRPDRIQGEDVQSLLKQVAIKPSADYSREFPEEMPCRIILTLRDGQKVEREKRDYEGFRSRPMSWETAVEKFEKLAAPFADRSLRQEIIHAVSHLESIEVSELAGLLGKVRVSSI